MIFNDWFQLVVEKRGVPDGWRWNSCEFVGESRSVGAFIIKGAVCTEVYKSGKRKGQKNWRKRDKSTEATHLVTAAQLDEAISEWEAETGKCHECGGDGQRSWGYSKESGQLLKPCKRCDATGAAPSPRGSPPPTVAPKIDERYSRICARGGDVP